MGLRGTAAIPNNPLDTVTSGQVYEGPAPLVDASALGETSVHDEPSPNQVGAADAVQVVTITSGSSGDTFTLTLDYQDPGTDNQTTAAIAYDATASAVEAAIEALAGVADGDCVVTGSAGGPFTVTWQNTGAYDPRSEDPPNISGTGTGCTVTVASSGA